MIPMRDLPELTIEEILHTERMLYGSDEYRFMKSSKVLRHRALNYEDTRRKITVPFDRLYQMIHSYIINNQISYTGKIPCVPGKDYEYPFIFRNNIYGLYNKYTIPEHLIYEMNLTDYRRLTVLMNSEYGEGEGERFVYYLNDNEHVKILDADLAITLLKYAINKNIDNRIANNDKVSIIDFYNYDTSILCEKAGISRLRFFEFIFGDMAEYIDNRYNIRCKLHDEFRMYTWGDSMFEPINITYNGINFDVQI